VPEVAPPGTRQQGVAIAATTPGRGPGIAALRCPIERPAVIDPDRLGYPTEGGCAMGLYMSQFSYTPEAWAALVRQPEDRSQALGRLCEQLGAKLVNLYYSFGEYDGVIITDAPDETTATAVILAAIAPGHVRAVKTVPLLTVEQTMEALRKAGAVAYRAPGAGGQ
jgi:uncharacterized protein with GYD domain